MYKTRVVKAKNMVNSVTTNLVRVTGFQRALQYIHPLAITPILMSYTVATAVLKLNDRREAVINRCYWAL